MSAKAKKPMIVINFTIDGRHVQARPGWTILETARANGIDIPTLCFHPAVKPWGSCRLCVVEVVYGKRSKVAVSCLTRPVHELEVFTDSERVRNVRRWVLEMLLAECPAKPGTITDPNGLVTTYTYDTRGRVSTVTLEDAGPNSEDLTTSTFYELNGAFRLRAPSRRKRDGLRIRCCRKGKFHNKKSRTKRNEYRY